MTANSREIAADDREDFDEKTFATTLREAREALGMTRTAFIEHVSREAGRDARIRRLFITPQFEAAQAQKRREGKPTRDPTGLSLMHLTALEGVLKRPDDKPSRPSARAILIIEQGIPRSAADTLWKAAGYTPSEVKRFRDDPKTVLEVKLPRLREAMTKLRLVRAPDMKKRDDVRVDPAILAIRTKIPDTAVVLDRSVPGLKLTSGDIVLVRKRPAQPGEIIMRAGKKGWEMARLTKDGSRVLARSGPVEKDQREWGVVTRTISIRALQAS